MTTRTLDLNEHKHMKPLPSADPRWASQDRKAANLRVLVLALAAFAIGTGVFVVTGLLGGVARDFSIPVSTAGHLITAYAVAYAVLSPLLVAVTSRVARRRLLVAVLALFALANLAAFRLDRRLAGLATSFGAAYTRYADDLTFSGSGGLLAGPDRFRAAVADIARYEGFRVNERKSMLATSAGRQRVCGIIVNERLNVTRGEYDRLRAILHNAARRGPDGENRAGVRDFRAHLLGRIAWVESLNPDRGAKLRGQFARIRW